MNIWKLSIIGLLLTILLYPAAGQEIFYEIDITLSENQAYDFKISLENI
jgi:hypothetical protein